MIRFFRMSTMFKLEQIYADYLVPFLRQRYSDFDTFKFNFIYDSSSIIENSFDAYRKANLYISSQQDIYLASFHIFEAFTEPSLIYITIIPDNIITNLSDTNYTIIDYSNLNYYIYCGNYTYYLQWCMASHLSPFLALTCWCKDLHNKKQYIYCADGDTNNFLTNLDVSNQSLLDVIHIHYNDYNDYLCAYTILNKFDNKNRD